MGRRVSIVGGVVLMLAVRQSAARAQSPAGPADALSSGLAAYRANHLEQAESLFVLALQRDPDNDDAKLWLADVMRRLQVPGAAAGLARQVLAHRPCSSFGHTVLAEALNPWQQDWRRVNTDSVWGHLQAAVRCDSTDGNAWISSVFIAAQVGNDAAANLALRKLVSLGFLSPASLNWSRWVLQQLPDSALLITNGDLDTFPALALQVAEGLRGDVTVINRSLLNAPWYVRMLRDRRRVPMHQLSDSVIEHWQPALEGSRAVYLADIAIAVWRQAESRGELERPLVFALTVGEQAVRDTGRLNAGRFALAGGYFEAVHGPDTAQVDTLRARRNLATADLRALAGPVAGRGDRSPIRTTQPDNEFATLALWAWTQYLQALGGRADARATAASLADQIERDGLADGEREILGWLRAAARQP